MILTNSTGEAIRTIKTAIKEKFETIEGAGKVWKRYRFANGLEEWLKLAVVESDAGVEALRVVFVYLQTWDGVAGETARSKKITATIGVEIVFGFFDGSDEINSTELFEDYMGAAVDKFLDDKSLGFTDANGYEVTNSILRGETEGEGKPVVLDGVLSHRQVCSIDVTFTRC